MYGPAVAKAHLMLGRMYVDIHRSRVDREKEDVGGLTLAVEHIGVSAADGVRDRAVTHVAPVDEEVLPVCSSPRRSGSCDHPGHGERTGLGVDLDAVLIERFAKDVADPPQGRCGPPLAHRAVIVEYAQPDFRAGERDSLDRVNAMAEFRGLRAQELAARRYRVKKIAHVDRRAGRAGRWLWGICAIEHPRVGFVAGAGNHRKPRDGCDRGQGFATETHCVDGLELFQRDDLAGGVPGEGQWHLRRGNSGAIVDHGDASHPARFEAHFDRLRTGIDGVFQ